MKKTSMGWKLVYRLSSRTWMIVDEYACVFPGVGKSVVEMKVRVEEVKDKVI